MIHKLKTLLLLLAGVACIYHSTVSSAAEQGSTARGIDFNREVRPILSDNCFSCHGPDDKQRMAGLRLDTLNGISASPGVIVAGSRRDSKLYQRISAKEPARRMPPASSGHSLTEAQIELVGKWIDEGAKWSSHWAFEPPRRPAVPEVKRTSWPRNSIDNFVLARLEREGLAPSPEADKVTLLRRASLDLTGLPPTLSEIDAFLADKSSDAYEKQLDRLLASSHYGERMAMQWLDLARYADTHGYHIDSHRDMWPWRDWLIGAFNRNLRYDEMTIEQLAGDLLPNATRDQLIASGFNRNHMVNFEGGAIPEEYQVEYVVDRVEATSTTWLGLTMGCARCHTHKYDPISHREFYEFFAFFNNISEKGLDGQTGNAMPVLELPTDAQKAQMEKLTAAIKDLEAKLDEKVVGPLEKQWETPMMGRIAESAQQGLAAQYELDGNFSDGSGNQRHGRLVTGDSAFGNGVIGRGLSFDGDTRVSFGASPQFDSGQPFTITFWMRGGGREPASVLQKISGDDARRGYEFYLYDRALIGIQRWSQHLVFRLSEKWPDSAIEIRTSDRLSMTEWYHVTLTGTGEPGAKSLALFINGRKQKIEVLKDSLKSAVQTNAPLEVGNRELGKAYRGSLDDLRIFTRALTNAEIEHLALLYPVQAVLSGVYGKRTKEDSARVREYFITRAGPRELADASASLKSLRKEKDELARKTVSVMVMGENSKPRETFILARGDYRNKGEKVTPDVPRVLPSLPEGSKRDRLALAKWLVDTRHPLTARVAVNRYWQMYFGNGIVKTAEDFGSQGEPPSHQELLDWLATEFVRSGWDIKAMQKLILSSATYRQSSKTSGATRGLIEKDPENRLLARGPRFRLQAESIRDVALAVSGLLNGSIGGASVYPYQPPGIWEELAFGDGFSAQAYKQSKGADLYRRSMYTFWKRTAPPASLAIFDAPDREKCTARRPVTNTPLQALVLMNDPTYVEAARALAARSLREGGKSADDRLRFAFRLATARIASKDELAVLRDLLAKQQQAYANDAKAAGDLLGVGESKLDVANRQELAAWTVVASAILNLDEAVTKE